MELKVIKLVEGEVAINFDELKDELKANLERYKGFEVTEKNFDESKKIRANLNALSKAINQRKIEIKKRYLEPYTVFEAQAKELMAIIDEVNSEIDKGVKSLEEKEKEQKKLAIEELWREMQCNLVKLEYIFDDKWLNKGVTMRQVETAITEKITGITNDLALISTIFTDDNAKLNVKTKYLNNGLDVKKAIEDYQKEIQTAKLFEAVNKAQEKEKEYLKKQQVEAEARKAKAEKVEITIVLRLYENQIDDLQKYLDTNNIEVVE